VLGVAKLLSPTCGLVHRYITQRRERMRVAAARRSAAPG
jgi:hypothetical protein